MPQISVIVPVYKVEPYLRGCIDSILAQTFTDFELILVDDGSPDNCPAICDEYAAKDSRIRVIHQENGGLSAARNSGIGTARGNYLCFADSDDLVAPDYLAYLHGLLVTSNADFSVCGCRRFQEEGELAGLLPEERAWTCIPASEFFLRQMGPETEMGVWNKLFRRELFGDLRFEEGRLHEDVLLSVDLAAGCRRGVAWGRAEKYFYRQNPNGIMGQSRRRISPDRIYAGDRVIGYGRTREPAYLQACLRYAVEYPWMTVDGIYVRGTFRENRAFLSLLREQLRKNMGQLQTMEQFSLITKARMALFARSPVLYGFNAYARLLRVYVYRILHLDAYADGHGI